MAGKVGGKGGGDGSKVPVESVELDGNIITAAKSTMDGKSYERGYPEAEGRLKMDNFGKGRK